MSSSRHVIARALLFSGALLAVGCVPAPDSTPAPTPAPVQTAPAPTPTPTPVAAAKPKYANWMDAPRSSGDWGYSAIGGNPVAVFGERSANRTTPDPAPRFTIQCLASSRQIRLSVLGSSTGDLLTIRTETADRALRLTSTPESNGAMAHVDLSARDPLLDAMALTKGRFAVETPDSPTLYLPAWAEVTRVIEDCR